MPSSETIRIARQGPDPASVHEDRTRQDANDDHRGRRLTVCSRFPTLRIGFLAVQSSLLDDVDAVPFATVGRV